MPRELAEQVEAAMPLLGLTNRTEAVVAALRLLRRHAREAALLAAIDTEYGPGGVVPAGRVTAGLGALVSAEDAGSAGSAASAGSGDSAASTEDARTFSR